MRRLFASHFWIMLRFQLNMSVLINCLMWGLMIFGFSKWGLLKWQNGDHFYIPTLLFVFFMTGPLMMPSTIADFLGSSRSGSFFGNSGQYFLTRAVDRQALFYSGIVVWLGLSLIMPLCELGRAWHKPQATVTLNASEYKAKTYAEIKLSYQKNFPDCQIMEEGGTTSIVLPTGNLTIWTCLSFYWMALVLGYEWLAILLHRHSRRETFLRGYSFFLMFFGGMPIYGNHSDINVYGFVSRHSWSIAIGLFIVGWLVQLFGAEKFRQQEIF